MFGITLKPAAGVNPIEVAVDIDLQQHRWVVGRTTRCGRIDALKTKCSLHDRPRYDLDDQKIRQLQVFSHSLDRD
jgi:hypothetical protein